MAVLPTGIGPVTGGYQIERSLRFNSADSAYLNRTFTTPTNNKIFTWSSWIKIGKIPSSREGIFLAVNSTGTVYFGLEFNASGQLNLYDSNAAGTLTTTQVFRDPSAWYHVVMAVDTTQATSTNRIKLYLNGLQITTFSTTNYAAQNSSPYMNSAISHSMGSWQPASGLYFDGYMTEINFLDGQVPTTTTRTVNGVTENILTQLGEFSSSTGVWTPKAWTGSYGTNGFYLKFADNSGTTSTTLGKDSSGNGNNWTPNNFSVTAGAGNDSLVDSPTSYGTDTGVGGEVRGNYCTLNPLDKTAAVTLSNGNLQALLNGINYFAKSTIAISSGKWYWEVTASATAEDMIGITKADVATTGYFGSQATSYGYYKTNGNKYNSATGTAYGASYASGDIIGVALDLDAGTLTYYKNGVSQGTAFTGLSGTFFAGVSTAGTGGTQTINFGQRPFEKWNGSAYVANTAPSGFKALCTQNFTTPTIGATSTTQAGKYFNVSLYNGNGNTGQTITGVGFQPDFTWLKNRNQAGGYYNSLFDAVRGAGYRLRSDSTVAEANATAIFSAFTSDGFTFPAGQGNTIENDSVGTYASWNWKANGAGSTNTAGTITSTVSANTTSGFSIVSFAFPATASKTVGHGLGVAPSMVIVKSRSNGTQQWITYHASSGNTGFLCLNKFDAFSTNSTVWDNTSPTSTVFTLGSGFTSANFGADGIAYCFADVDGYSKAFSYASNNSADNAFVYLGFRPRWIMIKSSTTGGTNFDWVIYDTARMTYNYIANTDLRANLTITEGGTARNPAIDILSNGFKVRSSAGEIGSSTLYVGMAFAETPFKYALAR